MLNVNIIPSIIQLFVPKVDEMGGRYTRFNCPDYYWLQPSRISSLGPFIFAYAYISFKTFKTSFASSASLFSVSRANSQPSIKLSTCSNVFIFLIGFKGPKVDYLHRRNLDLRATFQTVGSVTNGVRVSAIEFVVG